MAKNQQTDPLDGLDKLKTFLEQIDQQDDGKAATFKQALMLLASPESIALASQKDIHLSADGQLAQTAGGSINLNSQKNVIAQAGQKVSLFAAGQGINAIAAKSKLELQAQADAIEAIARKVIKLISTEDRIEITSPKEMVVNAGGSQLMINASGVFIKTGGKFESKAGQHVFSGGNKVKLPLPNLPMIDAPYILQYLVKNKENQAVANKPYLLMDEDGNVHKGVTSNDGFMKLKTAPTSQTMVARVMMNEIEEAEEEETGEK